jgi:maleate isomerase
MADLDVSTTTSDVGFEAPGLPVRFGLVALATDLTSEGDFSRIFTPEAAVHTTRVAFANPTTPENLRKMAPLLTEAAALITPGVELAAICYSCTSAAATIGEETVERFIQAVRPGVPVVTPTGASARAFNALGVRSISVVTPYLPEASIPVGAWFERKGFNVTRLDSMGLADDRDMARVSRRTIVEAALAADGPENEAIFLSCTALPAVGAIAEIEARTGKPVVTSNQASAWEMLRRGGFSDWRPEAYGRLFTLPLEGVGEGFAA